MSTDARRLQIIIVGAGLGGLSAALFLREHHDVTILERSVEPFPDDYGISVVANAYGLLQKRGVNEENFPHCILNHMRLRDKDNKSIADVMFDTRRTVGAPSIFAKRSALAAEITRLATDPSLPGTPTSIIRGARVVGVDVSKAEVVMSDGQKYSGDVLIGADGINSLVRTAVIEHHRAAGSSFASGPEDWQPRASGVIAYVSAVPREVFDADPDLQFQAEIDNSAGLTTSYGAAGMGSKTRVLIYPISKTHFQVVGYHPEEAWADEFNKTKSSIIKSVSTERAVEDFTDFHPSIKKLFSVTFELSSPDVWRIRDLAPLPTWSAGRAMLIGDAAHAATPHTGHGANMAMEDGEALGYILRDITGPLLDSPEKLDATIKERFSVFESIRVTRSQYVQKAALLAGGLLPPSEGRFNPQLFSRTMHYYAGAEAVINSPATQPSYDI
ncbi:FAD/NAD(P)-binding domain-containing protein [Clavulina sp. PMI_390]|nr:FAD/NAD(P)-binding domain-containing protein [Clavulina sp. PMI_390]